MKILIYNNKSQLVGNKILVEEIRDDKRFKLRTKNAYFAMMKSNSGWDGYKRFITPTGLFGTGLLSEVLAWLEENEEEYTLVDKRNVFKDTKVISSLRDFDLRDYQLESVTEFLNNRVKGLRFQRGVLWEATNAGKNIIAAAIFASFSSKRKGLFLINNQVIFQQAVIELKQLLGNEVGQVSSKKTDWKRLNVCMVQTLANRIKTNPQIKRDVAGTDIMLIDESDEVISRKDTQSILTVAYNCPIRCGLTGTEGLSDDKIRNKESVALLGPVIHKVSNKDLVDKGHSAKPIITILEGNTEVFEEDWPSQLEFGIIKNKERNKKVWKRVKQHLKEGRKNILVLVKYHSHIKYLYKTLPKSLANGDYKIGSVHHKTKNREAILQRFKDEKIDILICTMIIRRGKNLPRMRALINAAGGKSHSNLLQIFGRALRKEAGVKEEAYIDDFFDDGGCVNLRRHSKRRVTYYKQQGFEVKELYK